MITLGVIFFACVVLSAFFSGAEMAFVSANKFKIKDMADSGNPDAQSVEKLHAEPEYFLTAVLIGNNIVNVAATAILTYWLHVQFHIDSEWLVTAIMLPLILIFGEIVPKDYCRFKSQHVLLRNAKVLTSFAGLFHYPSIMVNAIIGSVLRIFGVSKDKSIFVSEGELRSLIEESAKTGVLEQHEKLLIDRIIDFERLKVDSVMIPLSRVAKVDISDKVKDVKEIAKITKAKALLVYEEDPSIIVGMVYVFDVLFERNENKGLKDFLRSPVFISHKISCEKAFLTLQQMRQSYAVITDKKGDVLGVVPIEKLLAV